jgi:hypothetical protein
MAKGEENMVCEGWKPDEDRYRGTIT